FDEVRDDRRRAVERDDLVDCDDVGMPKLGGGAGLAQKTLAVRLVFQRAGVRQFHGNQAVQLCVAGLPDRSDPADADSLEQLELAELSQTASRRGQSRILNTKPTPTCRAIHFITTRIPKLYRTVTMWTAHLKGGWYV